MTSKLAKIIGTGHAFGSEVVANSAIADGLGVTPAWIEERVGIVERRRASSEEFPSTLGLVAARQALVSADMEATSLDAIICATITPDFNQMPSTACLIQAALGTRNIPAFDLAGACAGFIYAVEVASKLVLSEAYRTVLVVAAELMTRITDNKDVKTSVLFSDGAGAVVVSSGDNGHGILAIDLGADGTFADCLVVPGGGSRNPASCETVSRRMHFMQMNGHALSKAALRRMPASCMQVLDRVGLKPDDVNMLIPHQANARIIDGVGERLCIGQERVFSNIRNAGNTGAASIPIALDQCVRAELLRSGDLVLLTAFGGGITWGSALMRW